MGRTQDGSSSSFGHGGVSVIKSNKAKNNRKSLELGKANVKRIIGGY
jgi:hypothetical protein